MFPICPCVINDDINIKPINILIDMAPNNTDANSRFLIRELISQYTKLIKIATVAINIGASRVFENGVPSEAFFIALKGIAINTIMAIEKYKTTNMGLYF